MSVISQEHKEKISKETDERKRGGKKTPTHHHHLYTDHLYTDTVEEERYSVLKDFFESHIEQDKFNKLKEYVDYFHSSMFLYK